MHVAHTARLETFDIFSQAAKTGCSLLLQRPSAFSDGAFDCALGGVVSGTSESENELEVRLIDGTEESEDFVDKGELGVSGEPISGDCGVGLSAPSPSHKGAGRGFRWI